MGPPSPHQGVAEGMGKQQRLERHEMAVVKRVWGREKKLVLPFLSL